MAFKLTKVNNIPGELITIDTDNVPEGTSNLYYTEDRTEAKIVSIRNTSPTIQDKHFYTTGEINVKIGDLYWQIVHPIEIIKVFINFKSPPSGEQAVIQVVKNTGSNPSDTLYDFSISSGTSSVESTTAPVQLVAGDYVRIDILQRGSTSPGEDLTVSFKYRSIIEVT